MYTVNGGADRRTAVYENFENIILFSKLRLDTDLTRPNERLTI